MTGESRDNGDESSLNEAFQELGYPERMVPSTIGAFKTVDQAKRWIDLLGSLALRSEYVYEISISGLQPEDYSRWRDAGLNVMSALRTPRRLAAAGLYVDDYLRWKSAGLGAGLERLLPYLQADLTFEDLIGFLSNWNTGDDSDRSDGVAELAEMLKGGLGVEEFRRLLGTGLSGHQISTWIKTGIPSPDWSTWMSFGFDPETAAEYFAGAVSAAMAKPWRDLSLPARDALAFIKMGVPVTTAREWIEAGITGTGAVAFLTTKVSLETARVWTEAGLPPDEAVEFIELGVALDDALAFQERGIGSWQLERTELGLEMNLDPWQEDPADQLPRVIEPGRISLTLWTTALGGDPQAHDVSFTWDGLHTAEWFEDISPATGDLSPASSSPVWGVASWPDGKDVLLTYTWSDFGMRGYARLAGAAPTCAGSPAAHDPRQWIRLGEALIDFVLLDLGSGQDNREELSAEYYDPVRDEFIELDDLFRTFLDEAGTSNTCPDFNVWLSDKLSSGTYELPDDD